MRQMKDSGIEWIGEIPQSWDVLPNKYIMKKTKELCLKYSGQAILSLTMNGVIERDLDAGGKMPSSFDGYQLIKKGNLLLCLFDIDVTPRCAGLILKDGVTSPAYSQFVMTNMAYAPYFVYYYIMVDNTKELLHMTKNLRYSLNEEQFGAIKAPCPSLAGQERIAEFLDAKCAEVDALAGEIKEQIATLEEYKRSVITEAVTKGLDTSVPMKDSGIEWIGEIPQVWDVRKGKYLFAQRNERGNNVKLQLLSPTQNYGVIPQDEYERLSGMSAVKLDENINLKALKTIHKGDYCISLRSFQGGFEYSMNEGVISPAYQVFYPTVKISGGYYKYLFKDKGFISVINSYAMSLRDGKNISFEQFGNTVIPVPPLAEQERIAGFLDAKCAEVDALIAEKQNQLATLEEYKKSVIFEYVTGKKEVV